LLTSLLPGVRDLRTPLAVGYMWLIALWISLHKYLPETIDTAKGPMKSLYELGDFVGKGIVLTACSFVAYMLGSLVVRPLRLGFHAKANEKDEDAEKDSKFDWLLYFVFDGNIADSTLMQLRSFVDSRLREVQDVMLPWFQRGILEPRKLPIVQKDGATSAPILNLRSAYVASIIDDLELVGIQLQAKNRDFWDTYDRKTAEAQFRYGIFWPMVAVIGVISWQSSWWWLFLLIIPAWFFLLAARLTLEVKATLVQAIIVGLVVPPILEDLDKAVKNRREQIKQQKEEHKERENRKSSGNSQAQPDMSLKDGSHDSPAQP
jgi:hypothetical protein